jgi:hypothetical protein
MKWFHTGLTALLLMSALAGSACHGVAPAAPTVSTGSTSTTTDPPTVTAISPATGGDVGGTTVTVTGTNFTSAMTVTINGVAPTNILLYSSTSFTAVTGPGTIGTGDVVVTIGSQSGKLVGGFSYLAPLDTVMHLSVYNHTAGRMGGFTFTAQSGTTLTYTTADLADLTVPASVRKGVKSAISVDNVDGQRIVVREGAQGGITGAFVQATTVGTINIPVPYTQEASFDVFLMNTGNGADYSLVDSGALGFGRALTISRGADAGGATGPDSSINTLVREASRALTYPWMSYGTVTRVGQDGDIFVIYIKPNGNSCVTYTRAKGMLYLNPERCAAVPLDVTGAMLQDGFELLVGLKNIFGSDSSGVVDWNTNQFTPLGRDLLAYVYLKDIKGW